MFFMKYFFSPLYLIFIYIFLLKIFSNIFYEETSMLCIKI